MPDIQRDIIRHSVADVICILENEPVRVDMVPEITAVQVLNRVSIAHLSIERALKFLITTAGGPLVEIHNLKTQYRKLLRHAPQSAKYLEEVFDAAVRHYRYNPNATGMAHLKALERYLEVAGSDKAFQDIRYWELTQSLDGVLLRQISLSVHIELLHGLSEILLAIDRPPMGTIVNRVERAVEEAMWPTAEMAYGSGSSKEYSVQSYIEWRRSFDSWSDALADAVRKGFNIGDDFMATVTSKAYRTLLEAADPAVRYFASTLDTLPTQPRDVIPSVEWLSPKKERYGSVITPAGTCLGFIGRGMDGLWYITPLRAGPMGISAKAKSQTDARCYLAILLSRPARITVNGEGRSVRIVGEENRFCQKNYAEMDRRFGGDGDGNIWTHKVEFWDRDHGIEVNSHMRLTVPRGESGSVVTILEGTVTDVTRHEVWVSGQDYVTTPKHTGEETS